MFNPTKYTILDLINNMENQIQLEQIRKMEPIYEVTNDTLKVTKQVEVVETIYDKNELIAEKNTLETRLNDINDILDKFEENK